MRPKSSLNYFTIPSSFILEDKPGLHMIKMVCNGGSLTVRIPSHLSQKKPKNRWAHSELKPCLLVYMGKDYKKVTSKSGEEKKSKK